MRSQIYVAGFLVAGLFAFGFSSFGAGMGRGHSQHEYQEHQEHPWHGRYYCMSTVLGIPDIPVMIRTIHSPM